MTLHKCGLQISFVASFIHVASSHALLIYYCFILNIFRSKDTWSPLLLLLVVTMMAPQLQNTSPNMMWLLLLTIWSRADLTCTFVMIPAHVSLFCLFLLISLNLFFFSSLIIFYSFCDFQLNMNQPH